MPDSPDQIEYLKSISKNTETILGKQNDLKAGQERLQKELDEIKEDVHLIRGVASGADAKAEKALTLLNVEKEAREKLEDKLEKDKEIIYRNYRKEIGDSESRTSNKLKVITAEGKYWTLFHFVLIVGYIVTTAIAIYAVLK